MLYRIFGLPLASDVALPELPRTSGRCVLRVRTRGTLPRRGRWTWLEESRNAEQAVWLAIGRHGDDWMLRFPRLADFQLTSGATVIAGCPKRAVPPHTFRHLLVDTVLPIALSARGHLLLHASGVSGPRGAALFVGGTGTGKSTLAAVFEGPLRPFSDDTVRVSARGGRFIAAGAYPGARLWPDAVAALGPAERTYPVAHYTEKRRVRLASGKASRAITAIYVLQDLPAARVTIRKCTRRAAVVEILSHAHSLDPTDPAVARRHLDVATALSAVVPVFTLAFPVALERIRDVRDAVTEHLTALAVTKAHG